MSESLNGERWREGNAGHQISTSISIRKGVYQASKKYKPAIAFKMTVTTDGVWPTGKDEPRDYKVSTRISLVLSHSLIFSNRKCINS